MADSGEFDSALIGRRAEVDLFDGWLGELTAGRGGCVLVEGEPGLGKTALLEAVLTRAAGRGIRIFAGVCDERAALVPLSVLFGMLGRDEPAEPPAAAADDSPDRAASGAGWALALADGDPVAAAVERVLARVDRLSAEGPLLLAVDDLHLADETTLQAWRRLCRMAGQASLLLVATCEQMPEDGAAERLRQAMLAHAGAELILDRLSPEAVTALTRRILEAEPDESLCQRLDAAHGNPLYVRELIDDLVRSGEITVADGVAGLAGSAAPTNPASSADVLSRRLDSLSEPARELLVAATPLGISFTTTDLSAVLGGPEGELTEPLHEALTAAVLESTETTHLRFRHGLLRQVLCETLSPADRSALHKNAVRALAEREAPVEHMAEIVLAALDAADGWEVDWIEANALALSGRAPEAAVRLLAHAASRASHDYPARDGILEILAALNYRLMRYGDCVAACTEILAGNRDPERRGPAWWLRARALTVADERATARKTIAEALAEPETPELWRVRLQCAAGTLLVHDGEYAEAVRAADRCRADAVRIADPVAVGHAMTIRLMARSMTARAAEYIDALEEALAALADRPELVRMRVVTATNLISALTGADRFEQAAGIAAEAYPIADRDGGENVMYLALVAGELAFARGRWDDALAEIEPVAQWLGEIGLSPLEPLLLHGQSALIAAHRSERELAETHLRALPADMAADAYKRLNSAYAVLAEAVLAEAAGEPARALATLAVILEPEYGQLEEKLRLLPVLVRLALAADREDLVDRAVEAARAEAEHRGFERGKAVVQWCRGLERGNAETVVGAAEYFRRVGRWHELAEALEDAAEIRARAGSVDHARAELAEAVGLYVELGAQWDLRRATERLRSHGVVGRAHPVHHPVSRARALTQTEQRIAARVVRGESNSDIAEALRMPRRTVETHVLHILAKLGARSRPDVPARMARNAL